jgi:hypothetical protein
LSPNDEPTGITGLVDTDNPLQPMPEQYEDDKDDEDPEEEQAADQLPGNGINTSGSPADHGPVHRWP